MSALSTATNNPGDLLILVDHDDRELGFLSKEECHRGAGTLHRVFSVFLFNGAGEILLQQRSAEKPLWPLYWSNSCCSHPRPHETVLAASVRRVHEELRLSTSTSFLYKFEYRAQFSGLGVEHELCHVLAGLMPNQPDAHPDEVSAWRLVEPGRLDQEMNEQPGSFTPWLLLEWPRIRGQYWGQVTSLLNRFS